MRAAEQLNIRLSPEQKKKLEQIAVEQNRSIAGVIKNWIENYELKEEKKMCESRINENIKVEFDGYNYTGQTEYDNNAIMDAKNKNIDLKMDQLGRVWDEGGRYIADVVYARENGIYTR